MVEVETYTYKYQLDWITSLETKDLQVVKGKSVLSAGIKSDSLTSTVLYVVSKRVFNSGFKIVKIWCSDNRGKTCQVIPSVTNHGCTEIFAVLITNYFKPPCTMILRIMASKVANENNLIEKSIAGPLWSALTDNLYTDVQLHVGDEVIPAHKVVLASRSPVFRAMFQNDMEEARTNQVKIIDVDPDVFRDFLYFLYTGELKTNKPDYVYSLIDKYDVAELDSLNMTKLQDLEESSNVLSLLMSCPRTFI